MTAGRSKDFPAVLLSFLSIRRQGAPSAEGKSVGAQGFLGCLSLILVYNFGKTELFRGE